MSVPQINHTITRMDPYEGGGGGTSWPIDFLFIDESDIKCRKVAADGTTYDLTYSTDYTVEKGELGGSLEFPVAGSAHGVLAEGETLYIYRQTEFTQKVTFSNDGVWDMEVVGWAVNKITMLCQELSELTGRSITFDINSMASGVSVPDPDPNKALFWSEDGTGLVNKAIADAGGATVPLPLPVQYGGTNADTPVQALINLGFSALARSLVAAADQAAARTVLGIGAAATEDVVPLAKGGTGANNATAAKENLEITIGTDVGNLIELEDVDGGGTPGLPAVNGSRLTDLDFSPKFQSSEQTITRGATLTLPHGLSAKPAFVEACLICKTAEYGYAIGEEVKASIDSWSGSNYGVGVSLDNSDIYLIVGVAGIPVLRKDTAAMALVTDANWRLVAKAW